MTTDDPVFHKPKSFIAARNLLYVSLFLSAVNVTIYYIRLGTRPNFFYIGWITSLISCVLAIIFIRQMDLCKKWPRTVLTVWLAISFLSMVLSLFNPSFIMGIPAFSIWCVKIVLQIIAFIFLYGRDCENWFNRSKYEMFQNNKQ